MCVYIIFICVKTYWFYKELWFYDDRGSGLVLPVSKLHAIKMKCSYYVCSFHGRKSVSLFSLLYDSRNGFTSKAKLQLRL